MSKINTNEQDEFPMNMDEDEEYLEESSSETDNLNGGNEFPNMFSEETDEYEEETFEQNNEENNEENTQELTEITLNALADFYKEVNKNENITFETLRHTYFDTALAKEAQSRDLDYEKLLLAASLEDTSYLDLVEKMYKVPMDRIHKSLSPDDRETLLELLLKVSIPLIETVNAKLNGDLEGDISSHLPLTSPEEDVSDEELDIDMMSVNNVVETIMSVYESMYKPCFINRPRGVLTSEGVLRFNNDGSWGFERDGSTFTKPLYQYMNMSVNEAWGSSFVEGTIGSHCFSPNGDLVIPYLPMYHLYNINGIKADGTKIQEWAVFSKYLKQDVTQKVKNVLTRVSTDDNLAMQRKLIALFTNCIIVEQFDVTKNLALIYKIGVDASNVKRVFEKELNNIFAKRFGKIVSCKEDEVEVNKLFYVFDMNAYATEILFSYKSYENLIRSGNKPSVSRVVVGKNLDGTDYTVNLNSVNTIVVGIQGASRSGKGVLTLNILASIYGEGCPALYLDYKPDMAAALWNIEKYFTDRGIPARLFSVDGRDGFTGNSRSPRYFPFGMNLPEGVPVSPASFSIIPYVKSIQLYCLAVTLRQRKEKGYSTNKRLFIIMDEMQSFARNSVPFFSTINEFVAKNTPSGRAKKQDDSQENPLISYLQKLSTVYDGEIMRALKDVRDRDGGTGNAAMLLIAQKVNPDEWAFSIQQEGKSEMKNLPWKSSFAATLLSQTNLKFIGKNAGVGTSYGINGLKIPGIELVDHEEIMGYWVASGTAKPDDKSSKIFKSYLTLNENDFNLNDFENGNFENMPFTGGIVKKLDPSAQQRIINEDFLTEDGSVRDSVGLLGLMRMISGGDDVTLAKNMSAGYDLMHQLFEDLGLATRYSCLEEYLHDCAPESIFSLDELKAMFRSDTAQSQVVDLMGDQQSQATTRMPSWAVPEVTETTQQPPFGGDFSEPTQEQQNISQQAVNPTIPVYGGATGDGLISDTGNMFDEMPSEDAMQGASTSWDGGIGLDEELVQPGHTAQSVPPVRPTQPVPPVDDFRQQQQQSQESQQSQQVNPRTDYVSPNDSMHYSGEYSERVRIENNPFRATRSQGGVSTLRAFKDISNELLKQIESAYGSLQRIETIEITSTGIVLNDIAFRPRYDKEFIETLPYDVKQDVLRGNLTPLLHFDALYKFKHVHTLIIENPRLAEGRVKREMALPDKLTWYKLLQRKKYLKQVIIGGQKITDMESCDAYQNGGRRGYELEEQLSEKFSITNAFKESPLAGVWKTRPAKIATGALGATMGVKAVGLGIAIFGGWGLLFGAFAGYGAYRKYVKKD